MKPTVLLLPVILVTLGAAPSRSQSEPLARPPDLAAAQALIDNGQLDQAERELRSLLSQRDHPMTRNLLADVNLRQGDLGEAEAQLRAAAERFDSVQALLQLARLEARRRQQGEAAQTLRRALELAPSSEEVLAAYAKLSLGAAAPAPAIRALEPLVRMYPEVAEYSYLLGVARLQIGESDAATLALERALELDPKRALTMIALGMSLNNQKRFADAETSLLRSLELQPDSVEALAALAEAQAGLGKLEAAELHASRALEAGAAPTRALVALGMVRMAQQRYGEARDFLAKAVDVDPNSPKAHYQLSLAYARLGDRGSSQRHLELYRKALAEAEQAIRELRTSPGLEQEGAVP